MQALINLYETFDEALHAVQELEAAQVPPEAISLLVLNGKSTMDGYDEAETKSKKLKPLPAENPAAESPETHLPKPKFFSKLALHELPGLDPVAAYGWLLTSALENTPEADRGLNSAPPTGLTTCLTGHGVDDEHAHAYIEGLKHGSALIGVRVPPDLVETASRIMRDDHSPLDPHIRGKHYAAGRFNPEEFARVKRSERTLAMLIAGAHKN